MKLPKLQEGWGTAVILLGAVLAVGWAVVATDWTDGLGVVPQAGVGGLVAGLFLGWSVFRARTCHLLSTAYGLTCVGYLLGRGLTDELTWGERIAQLITRIFDWGYQAVTGGIGQDALIFVTLLSALFWILGYNAAWNTYRRVRVWRAILPLGVMVLVIIYYYIGPAPMMRYLALYVLFALLYIARSYVLEQEEIWQREQVAYDSAVRSDSLRVTLVMALITLSIAWALPGADAWPGLASTWRRLSQPLRFVQEEWQRLFSDLHGNPTLKIVEPYGASLPLGGPRALQDTVLMDIAAPREGRYYWFGAAYDRYEGNRWRASEKERILLTPGRQPPGMAGYTLRRTVTQTVTSYVQGLHLLIGASQPIAITRDAEALVNLSGDAPLEFIRVFSTLPLDAGDQYVVASQVSYADATSLREASTDYPDWVRRRYLQLPTSLPDRVRLLAEEITADADNPYDKAVALEQYLRHNIAYDLTPPDLPEGRDYVDFLLFGSQRDYCTGYASAMVVMARSLGIPARLAAGYSEGEYDTERGVFRVREKNAHSWAEVYFPDYGWIEFEPTASERPLIRPERRDERTEDDVPQGARQEGPPGGAGPPGPPPGLEYMWGAEGEPLPITRGPLTWLWVAGLMLIALAVGGWWAMENWGLRGLPAVEQAYSRVLRFGRWVGRPLRASDTPFEWVRDVGALLPEARRPIDHIVDLYVRSRFARGDPADPEAQAAWSRARPILWRSLLKRIGRSIRRRRT